MDDESVDIKPRMVEKAPVGTCVVLYYHDGQTRTGFVVAHDEDYTVIETMESEICRRGASMEFDLVKIQIHAPYVEIKEFGVMK